MDIKSIRLQNFKGFKDAKLKLKPLTVLLGPNSSGKSCFGQALVALSKSNASKGIPSLKFDKNSSVEFGSFSDLAHLGNSDQPVIIELGLRSGKVILAFGKGNKLAGINELDLESIKYDIPQKDYSVIIPALSQTTIVESKDTLVSEVRRNNVSDWTVTVASKDVHDYKLGFNGVIINSASELAGTAVSVDKAVPGFGLPSSNLASLLRSVSYLRPDRLKPERSRAIDPSDIAFIDDRGGGTDWFIYKNRYSKVKVFFFPPPSVDKEETKNILAKYSQFESYEMEFLPALIRWLDELGLASFLDAKSLDGERVIQLVATPSGQEHARPLTDVGFGLSQVLPILAKGLSLEINGLLVLEQPEAQLHPRAQAGLADFFCAMVRCGRNLIVETHSEEIFHRIRLRASMDDYLAANIGVNFLDEPVDHCKEPVPISLQEEAELKWPKGFLPDGIRTEMSIRAVRRAKPPKGM